MADRKLFKTKLCVLYRRGNCSRQSCSFAHGDTELKRFSGSGSFNGRRDYRGSDLRNKLERRRSPPKRYSPGRDARGRNALHGHRQLQYDRGHSTSRSPCRSEKKQRRKQHLDGQSDISGSFRVSDGSDGIKRKVMSSNAKDELEEQLKQVQLDVDMLDNRKCELEIHLENKVQEADSLVSRIQELETQLNKEQEDCKRTTSIIKKFIKVHSRHSKAQEELKRSQARLQKLGDQLAVSASRSNANDEDSSFNIASDGEPDGDNGMSPKNARKNHPSSSKRRHRISHETSEEARTANLRKGPVGTTTSEKLTKVDVLANQSVNNCKEGDGLNRILITSNGLRSGAYEENNYKRRKNGSVSIDSMEKVKGLEPGHVLPPTCMAAHAVDELIEMEKTEVVGSATTVSEKSASRKKTSFPYLPPPPPPPAAPKSAYKQYEDEDVDVDVEELDMEVRDVDINNEVDIEQL